MTRIHFKFQRLDENGQAQSWRSKRGRIEDGIVWLEELQFAVDSITSTACKQNVLVFTVGEDPQSMEYVTLNVSSGNAKQLKEQMDVQRSAAHVAEAERKWRERGAAGPFRRELCPCCNSTLDLSRFEPTPQFFCDYCETISTVPRQPETPENEYKYRLCEQCGMYSRPQVFTEFYFYFLFFFYGFWTNQSVRCPACMRGTAWKMLAINFLFVLGIIPSIWQLIRAYASDRIAGSFSGLHAANLAAMRRNYALAARKYQAICDLVPAAAGVHFNLGNALARNGEYDRAIAAFELSLDDCSNYRYAAGGLLHCYESLGRSSEIARLKELWDVPDGSELSEMHSGNSKSLVPGTPSPSVSQEQFGHESAS